MKKDIIKLQKRIFRDESLISSYDNNKNNAGRNGTNSADDVIGRVDTDLTFTSSSSIVEEGSGN